jgi:hypothetical protein
VQGSVEPAVAASVRSSRAWCCLPSLGEGFSRRFDRIVRIALGADEAGATDARSDLDHALATLIEEG